MCSIICNEHSCCVLEESCQYVKECMPHLTIICTLNLPKRHTDIGTILTSRVCTYVCCTPSANYCIMADCKSKVTKCSTNHLKPNLLVNLRPTKLYTNALLFLKKFSSFHDAVLCDRICTFFKLRIFSKLESILSMHCGSVEV
jgi:hypothetical protein